MCLNKEVRKATIFNVTLTLRALIKSTPSGCSFLCIGDYRIYHFDFLDRTLNKKKLMQYIMYIMTDIDYNGIKWMFLFKEETGWVRTKTSS